MSKGLARYERVAGRVRTGWNPSRARDVEERVERGLERRRIPWQGLAAAFAVAACAIVGYQIVGQWRVNSAPATMLTPAPVRSAMALEDGSVVDLEGADTVVETLETTAANTDLRVVRGSATFRVVHNPNRIFRVHAGGVTAEVVGTVFRVVRQAAEARVDVISGKVRVSYDGQETVLSGGSSVTVADRKAGQAPVAATPTAVPSADAKPTADPKAAASASNQLPWRELARAADFEQAYDSLQRVGRSDVRDNPDDLLLAADVARLSRHPAEAVPHLRAVIARHRHDPRAPLAAFTLGRVLLESLGRPAEAATAFRTAQELAPSGLLVEDALAREVEALSRAGETAAAQARAELYVRRYPQGRKVSLVRRHGGLD
jgi:transmembrane sensor